MTAQAVVDPFFAPYTREFYAQHHDSAHHYSYQVLAEAIARVLTYRKVLDVGCGTGCLLAAIWEMSPHIVHIRGIDAPQREREIRAAGTDISETRYTWFDLREQRSFFFTEQFDLAISLEVAEHLPEEAHYSYVRCLTASATTVLFSAARPGQGGTGHIAELPWEYWVKLFRRFSFEVDETSTEEMALKHRMPACPWYETATVFRWTGTGGT